MNRESRNIFPVHSPRTSRGKLFATTATICLALASLSARQAFAQTPPPPPVQDFNTPPIATTYSFSRFSTNAGRFYAFANLAGFNPDSNPQLQHQHSDTAAVIAGGGFRFSPLLSLELDYAYTGQRLDTPASAMPAAGTFADGSVETRMDTDGLALAAKFNFPLGRVDPYVAAGAGWYTTRLSQTSDAPGCDHHCRGTGPEFSRRSNDPGYHAAIGADIHITAKDIVSAELRYLRLKASFGDVLPDTVKVGGTFLSIGYRRYF